MFESLFIVHDNMLCSLHRSLSNIVHACSSLPFVSHPPEASFSVAPGRWAFFFFFKYHIQGSLLHFKTQSLVFLELLGTDVVFDSALAHLYWLCVCFFFGVCFLWGWGWAVSWWLPLTGTEAGTLWHGEASGKGLPPSTHSHSVLGPADHSLFSSISLFIWSFQ